MMVSNMCMGSSTNMLDGELVSSVSDQYVIDGEHNMPGHKPGSSGGN